MNLSLGEMAFALSLLVFAALVFALYVYALVHCNKHHSDGSRVKWLLIIGLIPAVGSIVYFLAAKSPRSVASTSALPEPPVLPVSPTMITASASSASADGPVLQDDQQRAAQINDSIAALARSHRDSPDPEPALSVDHFEQSPRFGTSESLGEMLGSLNTHSNARPTKSGDSNIDPPVSKLLYSAFFVSGPLMLVFSMVAAGYHPRGENISYRIGSTIGTTCIWPLILIGLFSIGRRFRNTRTWIIIALVVWVLGAVGNLATITRHNEQQRAAAELNSRAKPTNTTGARAVPNSASTAFLQSHTSPEPEQTSTADFDLSPGSDERLVKTIESARDDRYHAIVAAYARACESRPQDATLALERVRFIDQFASSEDFSIESSEEDQEAAVNWLTTRFADNPGTILYQLNRKYGPQFRKAVMTYVKPAESWAPEDHAKFLSLRAQRATDKNEQHTLARRSFGIKPTINAGLLVLASAKDAAQRKWSLGILDHPVFKTPQPWQNKQILEFLFRAGDDKRAVALYQELKAHSPALVQTLETATQLADSGRVGLAREVFAALPDTEWNRAKRLRARFEFELKYGNAEQAAAAYKGMCAGDLTSDLFLRDRFSLFVKHPASGWSFYDLLRLMATWLLIMALLAAPAVLLLPIHYWSLLRARRAVASVRSKAKWGLREIWAALGAFFVCQLMAIWLFAPEHLRTWTNKGPHLALGYTDDVLLTIQGLAWAAMAVILAFAFARARAWSLIGLGQWKAGRIVWVALGCTLGLRMALACYILIWPHVLDGEMASFPSVTTQLNLALLKYAGPAGLIAAVAMLVPVLEELFFRGILLQGLAKHIPFGWANVIQALLFAAAHENVSLFPFFLLFGVTCGVLARRSGGLLGSIIVHALNNLAVCIGTIAAHR